MLNNMMILCITFLAIIIIYWIMPIKKMKAVNEALKSMLQVFPITKLLESLDKQSNIRKKD
jgi:hypothetical protein